MFNKMTKSRPRNDLNMCRVGR